MKKKILIIVDAQKDFITGVLGSKEAEEAAVKIVDYIKNNAWDGILYTEDIHFTEEMYKKSKESAHMIPIHCLDPEDNHIEESIYEAIKNGMCPVARQRKTKFAADQTAINENLHELFSVFYEDKNVDFYFCGFCTDICVISNVFAFMNSSEINYDTTEFYVKADCCAGSTPENHEAALKVMNSCLINII